MFDGTVIEELGARWARARRAALRAVAGAAAGEGDQALADRAFEVDAVEASRRVFDNSLVLGQQFGRRRGLVPFKDLPAKLERLGGECLRGAWRPHHEAPAWVLERAPCGGCAAVCDAWREAVDGLVVGLTGEARATRHRSGGHGDGACVDVIYLDAQSPLRFGFIPDELQEGLAAIARFLNAAKGTRVAFLGVSEGVLAYTLEVEGCGGAQAATEHLTRALAARWPGLRPRDVSPRSPFERAEPSPPRQEPR